MMVFPHYSYSNYPRQFNNSKKVYYKEEVKKKTEPVKKEEPNSSSPMLEIMGISLYFDDILLICLLLFLMEEGIEDEWLYIAIILLLLS